MDKANSLAKYFASILDRLPSLNVTYPVETNAVFANIPPDLYSKLQEVASFYLWNEKKGECRFMFSYNNTKEEIDRFTNHF